MTSEQMKIDALLVTATGRLMSAASSCGELRVAVLSEDIEMAKRASLNLAEHMGIVDAVLEDVARIIEARKMARTMTAQIAAAQQGGLIH